MQTWPRPSPSLISAAAPQCPQDKVQPHRYFTSSAPTVPCGHQPRLNHSACRQPRAARSPWVSPRTFALPRVSARCAFSLFATWKTPRHPAGSSLPGDVVPWRRVSGPWGSQQALRQHPPGPGQNLPLDRRFPRQGLTDSCLSPDLGWVQMTLLVTRTGVSAGVFEGRPLGWGGDQRTPLWGTGRPPKLSLNDQPGVSRHSIRWRVELPEQSLRATWRVRAFSGGGSPGQWAWGAGGAAGVVLRLWGGNGGLGYGGLWAVVSGIGTWPEGTWESTGKRDNSQFGKIPLAARGLFWGFVGVFKDRDK